ncbi:pleckstrin homology domain-containing family S member 1 [Hemicordylus capensis]|uniref:pleckstrin homology domain-containing family S member 1 n=1 Tax=Hemicordylus capensis TaxID=884348 RepID=UPI002304CCF8|nr:pleckstrin homology domain-containing family S member 1 [Hemicordylus capensis]
MDSARRESTGNYGCEEVWKHGFFIKSPPVNLFTNQNSWKRRYFILSKSVKNGYTLRYLKGRQVKGNIGIDVSSEILIGIDDTEKMAIVKKMFKCEPTEVMTIRTESRVYYLIGSDSKEIEEWTTFLTAACHGQKSTLPASRGRSVSSPPSLDELEPNNKDLQHDNQYEVQDTDTCQKSCFSDDKKRPHSDPTPQEASEKIHVYESPRKLLQRIRHLPNSHCIDPPEEQSDEKFEEKELYDSPRNVLTKLDCVLSEFDNPEEPISADDNDTGTDDNEEYMIMQELVPEKKIDAVSTSNEQLTLPKNQGNNLKVEEDNSMKPIPPPRTFKSEKPLSVIQLSIILSKIKDDSQLEEVDITLPQGDLTYCLTLTEASGHICVSQWKDPYRIGCIFHQGDHIIAVNELKVKSMDEISLFVSRSTKKEVKLTVRRLPNSQILHAKKCMCS